MLAELNRQDDADLALNPLRLCRHPREGVIPLHPFAKQQEFLDRLAKVERIMGWDGPNRGGKSMIAAMAVVAFLTGWPIKGWQKLPWDLRKARLGPRRRVGCVTVSKAKSIEAQQRYIAERIPSYLLDKSSGHWNEKTGLGSDHPKIILVNGSTVDFLSDVQREQELEAYQWDLAWIDEAIDEWVYRRLIARLTDTGGKLIITSVAEKEWIYRVLRLKLLDREQQVPAAPGLIDTIDDSTMFDNELIASEDIEKSIELWGGRTSREARMRVFGQYVHLAGVVFAEYSDLENVGPTRTPARQSFRCTIYEGADPGYRNPFAWAFVAVLPDGNWEIFDEIYLKGMLVPEIAALVLKKRRIHGYDQPYVPARIDPAGDQKHHWGRKIVSVRAELQSCGVITTAAPAGKGSVDAGYQIIRAGLSSGRIVVQQQCQWMRWEFQTHRYKDPDKATEEFLRDNEAVVDAHNHLIAALRYAITAELMFSPMPSPDPPLGSAAYDILQEEREKATATRRPWK